MADADLHLHTTASDGRLTPTELVKLVASRGLKVVAVTDHDSTEGLAEAFQAARQFPQLTVIPGIELSTDLPGREVHMLGYFIDYRDEGLQQALEESREHREERGRMMVQKLEELGVHIEWQRVRELANGAVGRPHIAQALVEQGYIQYPSEAFQKFIGRDGPAYVGRPKAVPEDAIALIRRYKGVPVLAHPREMGGVEDLVPKLAEAGLAGMEVYYKSYPSDEVNRLLQIAQNHHLIPCGGTDYHAMGEPGEIEPGFTGPPLDSVHRLVALAQELGSPVAG